MSEVLGVCTCVCGRVCVQECVVSVQCVWRESKCGECKEIPVEGYLGIRVFIDLKVLTIKSWGAETGVAQW